MTQPTSLNGFGSLCRKKEPVFDQFFPLFLLNWRIFGFRFRLIQSVTDRLQTTDRVQTDRRTMKNLSPLHHRPQRGNKKHWKMLEPNRGNTGYELFLPELPSPFIKVCTTEPLPYFQMSAVVLHRVHMKQFLCPATPQSAVLRSNVSQTPRQFGVFPIRIFIQVLVGKEEREGRIDFVFSSTICLRGRLSYPCCLKYQVFRCPGPAVILLPPVLRMVPPLGGPSPKNFAKYSTHGSRWFWNHLGQTNPLLDSPCKAGARSTSPLILVCCD